MPPLKHLFYISANKKLKNSDANSKDFDKVSNIASKKMKQYIKSNSHKELTYNSLDKQSKNISKEFNLDMQIKQLNIVPLDMHHKTENSFAFSAYTQYKIILEDYEEEVITSRTITAINVAGKIFTLFCEAPQGQLEWTRSRSIDWSETILKNNPKPPEKSQINKIKSLWEKAWGWCKKLGCWIVCFYLGLTGLSFIIHIIYPLILCFIGIINCIKEFIIRKFRKQK